MSDPDAGSLLAQAEKLIGNGDLVQAAATYNQVVAEQPDNAIAWLLLSRIQLQLGNTTEAESSCKHSIATQPGLASAHFQLGNVYETINNADAAAQCYEQTVLLENSNAMAMTRLGIVRHHQGVRDVAIEHYLSSLKHNPYLPLTHANLGIAYQELQQFPAAEKCFRTVIKLQNNFPRIYAHLGYVLGHQGKQEDAVSAYSHALEYEPNAPDIHFHLSAAHSAAGYFDAAAACLRTALQHKPDYAEAHLKIADILQAGGNHKEAEKHYLDAIKYRTNYAEAHRGLATLLNFLGRQSEAVDHAREALRSNPDYADAHIALAASIITLQQPDEAMKHAERALEIEPNNINAIALAANISTHTGDKHAAYHRLKPLLDKGIETFGPDQINIALTFSLISQEVGKQDEAIRLLEKLLHEPALPDANRPNLLFNLGMLYDSVGDYDKAFSHYSEGNSLKPLKFDRDDFDAYIDNIINMFSPDFMMRMPRTSSRSERPIFVVGMARSGTSLVEQILASHPEVFGAGELPDIVQLPLSLPAITDTSETYPQCMPHLTKDKMDSIALDYLNHLSELSSTATRVIDKMPGNFMHLGLIALLFPDARVIHCMRDPVDSCLSCYFQDFSRSHPYSYDLKNLGAFYNGYRKIMQYWKGLLDIPIFEVQYEELVANQEEVSRSLVEFCGLEWDEQCLQYYNTDRFVGTASYAQVRQPIYKKSVNRWKNYEQYLEPLKKSLLKEYTRVV